MQRTLTAFRQRRYEKAAYYWIVTDVLAQDGGITIRMTWRECKN